MDAGRLVSVNVGRSRLHARAGRTTKTAIWKSPVAGRVAVRGVNLDGDDQADREVHGGPDKAVYAYAEEDVAWWAGELGRPLEPGVFGENLTVRGLDVSGARIGERWAIGTTLLEVAQPRLPCFKLGLRFDDPLMVRRFARALRPGAYLRILHEGELGAGDAVEVVARPGHDLTVAFAARAALHEKALLPELLPAAALPAEWRAWIEGRAAG